MSKPFKLTTTNGNPVGNNQASLTVGEKGPTGLMDFHLIDKLSHFDRERIPERVVHAKGAGAHGVFEVTNDLSKYTKAKFLDKIGKQTPVLLRFSTVGGEKGSADTERDPRGFAIKFYTEEGNWDMVGNNTPIFFIRDAIKFPDFIHTQKRNPQTNLKDANMFWDFLSLTPESAHQVSFLFSDRGTPDGYRFMNGYGSHTFKWVNKDGEWFYVKFHFKCDQGIKNLLPEKADKLKTENPDYATQDLFEAIERKEFPSWTFCVQIMTQEQAQNYKWNVLDVTKVWPHSDFPLIKVGKLTLNRNPENYFAEIEQAAFSPSHMVPGIEPSEDKMLQGRLFSYPDTHRHRLGGNYKQIPVNCPYRSRVVNGTRDGFMNVNGNQGKEPNYEPNSLNHFQIDSHSLETPFQVSGLVQRHPQKVTDEDFIQPGNFYRNVLNDEEKSRLVNNLANHMKNARRELQERQVNIFYKCDPEYGTRIAKLLGIPLPNTKLQIQVKT